MVSCKTESSVFQRQDGQYIHKREVYIPVIKRSFVKARYANGQKAYKGRQIIHSWEGYEGMCGTGMREPAGKWKYWDDTGKRIKKKKRTKQASPNI